MNHVDAWPDRSTWWVVPLTLLLAAAMTTLFLVPMAWIAGVAVVGLAIILFLIATTLDGKVEVPLLLWVASFPLGYYFLSFPREKALLTMDRMMVAVLLIAMSLTPTRKAFRLPQELRSATLVWGSFVLAAFASVALGGVFSVMFSIRTILDGFVLPMIIGWCVVRNFDVRKHSTSIHAMTCLMSVSLAGIGAAEMATSTDLLPLPGMGELYYAGDILRPNGPFSSNNSFAIIGLVTFVFLLFLWRVMGHEIVSWQRLLHAAGMASALATALMPMFRSVMLALLLVVLLDVYFFPDAKKMAVVFTALACAVAALVILSVRAPEIYRDRSEGSNVYQRIGQQVQTIELFKTSPWIGVGVGNFVHVAELRRDSARTFGGWESVNYPHSNLGATLAETGVMGFVPYVASQVLLLVAFRKLGRLGTELSRTVWIFFVYIFLSYWINGMSLTAGYYSDLNLWYMFVLMVLYKFAITQDGQHRAGAVQTPPLLSMLAASRVNCLHLNKPLF